MRELSMYKHGLFLLALVTSGVVSAQSNAEAVTKKALSIPQVKKGTKVQFEEKTEMIKVIPAGEGERRVVFTIHAEQTYEVLEAMKDGFWKLKVSTGRMHGSIKMAGQTIELDSDKPSSDPRIAGMVAGAGTAYVGKVSARGVLSDWKAVGKDGALMVTDKHKLSLAQFYLAQFPNQGLTESAEWEPAVGVHHCTGDGCIRFKTKCRLKKGGKDSLIIETAGGRKKAAFLPSVKIADLASAKPGTVKRILEISTADGLPIRIEALGMDKEMLEGREMISTSRITMKRKS